MREAELFTQADQLFTDYVAEITDEQWSRRVPSTPEWTVRQLVNHVAQQNVKLTAALNGLSQEVPDNVLGEVPQTTWVELAQRAESAAAAVTDPSTKLQGASMEITAGQRLGIEAAERTLHAWDLAHAIGANETLEPGLVQAVYDIMLPNADSLAASDSFGPAVEVGPDASLQDRLIAMTGRDPGYEHVEPNDDTERAEEVHRSS